MKLKNKLAEQHVEYVRANEWDGGADVHSGFLAGFEKAKKLIFDYLEYDHDNSIDYRHVEAIGEEEVDQ